MACTAGGEGLPNTVLSATSRRLARRSPTSIPPGSMSCPPTLSVEDAVAAISLAEVASWMEKLGSLEGKSIGIGGTGFAACVMCQCAKHKGAGQIIVAGRNPGKLERARANGATHTVEFNEAARSVVREITSKGADWFLDAAGHQSVFEAGLGYLKDS